MIKQFVARQLLPEYANDPTAQLLPISHSTIIDNPPKDIHMQRPGYYRLYSEECGGRESGLGRGYAHIICGRNGLPLIPKPAKKGHAGFFAQALTEVYVDMRGGDKWTILVNEYSVNPDDGRMTCETWSIRLSKGEKIEGKLPDRWARYIPAILAAQSKAQCVECGKGKCKAHYTVYNAPVGKEVQAI